MNNVSWLAIGLFAFGSGERAIAISRWRCSFNWAMPLEWVRQIKRHASETDLRCMAALFHEDTDRHSVGREAPRRFGGRASKVALTGHSLPILTHGRERRQNGIHSILRSVVPEIKANLEAMGQNLRRSLGGLASYLRKPF